MLPPLFLKIAIGAPGDSTSDALPLDSDEEDPEPAPLDQRSAPRASAFVRAGLYTARSRSIPWNSKAGGSFGLFTARGIPAGELIGYYSGRLYTEDEFEGFSSAKQKRINAYAMDLDGVDALLSPIRADEEAPDLRAHPLAAANEPNEGGVANCTFQTIQLTSDEVEAVTRDEEGGLFAAVALYSCRPIAPHRELLVSYGKRYAAEYRSGDSCELPSKPQSYMSLGIVPRSCVAFVPGSNDSEPESDESYQASDSADVDSSLLQAIADSEISVRYDAQRSAAGHWRLHDGLGDSDTNPVTFDASSSTPLSTLALHQLHMKGGRGVDDEHKRGPDEAADVASPLKRRVRALPVEVLSPVGWNGLLVQTATFRRLLRVRIEAPLLIFGARSRQIQRVLLRFATAWRRAHPNLHTFTSRPAVSVRRNDELGVGDSISIVLVVEHDTSVVEEAALRAELAMQILANVDYVVRIERAARAA